MSRVFLVVALTAIATGFRVKPKRRIRKSQGESKNGLFTQVVEVPGRACDGKPFFSARVMYPTTGMNMPIFAFAHGGANDTGDCGGGKGDACDYAAQYAGLLEPIAQAGYLVIAFTGCANSAKGGDLEMLDSIIWLRYRSGYPVDRFLPATVAGHSGGGWAALAAASNGKEVFDANVGLAMAMHPSTNGQQEPVVSTVYWTGELDEQADSQSVRTLFDQVPSGVQRAFAVWTKKDHESPLTDPNAYIYWATKVMNCKIYGSPAACSNRDEMCTSADFTDCQDEF